MTSKDSVTHEFRKARDFPAIVLNHVSYRMHWLKKNAFDF